MDSNVSVSKFFSINELKNAVVVDSEGFIYGKVMEYYLTDGKLFLKAYIEIKAKEKIVNVDRIISELEEKGVNIPSDAPLELIVTRAKEEGLDIYYKLAEKPYTLLKGLLPIDEIRWIDSTTLEKEIEEKITIVLLKTPREARYRGVSEQKEVTLVDREYFQGKLVLSHSKGILGYASELVVGPGKVGLRVIKRKGEKGYVNWLAFLTWLRRRRETKVAAFLSERIDPYRNSRIELSKLNELRVLLREANASRDIVEGLDKHIIYEKGTGIYIDIPWDSILKLRDVIIVK